jgi:hypothetical protein
MTNSHAKPMKNITFTHSGMTPMQMATAAPRSSALIMAGA